MEHGAGLKVEKVVLVDRKTQRIDGSPIGPENPEERHCRDGDGDQYRQSESTPTGVHPRIGSDLVDRYHLLHTIFPFDGVDEAPLQEWQLELNRQYPPPRRRSVAKARPSKRSTPGQWRLSALTRIRVICTYEDGGRSLDGRRRRRARRRALKNRGNRQYEECSRRGAPAEAASPGTSSRRARAPPPGRSGPGRHGLPGLTSRGLHPLGQRPGALDAGHRDGGQQ